MDNADRLRKVERQGLGYFVYVIPETDHWAGWHDADAIVYHADLIAMSLVPAYGPQVRGKWIDVEGEAVDRPESAKYGRLKVTGISAR